MNAFQRQCIELRKQDHTLSEIARLTHRPETSVYVHIRNIPLSVRKKRSIRIASGIRALQIAAQRRGKSTRTFITFTKWDENMIRLVSHLIFDGEIRRTGCSYNNRNLSLVSQVESAMNKIYDFKPKRYMNIESGVLRISYYNVELGAFIKKKAFELLDTVDSMPKKLKREFIRCFFDDEGCMDFRPKRSVRQIRGYQKEVGVLRIVQKLLEEFELSSTVKLPNELVLSGRKNLVRFQKEIGFSSGVRINGKRSNSIWKRSFEKRELLRRAIESFRSVGSNGVYRTPRRTNHG